MADLSVKEQVVGHIPDDEQDDGEPTGVNDSQDEKLSDKTDLCAICDAIMVPDFETHHREHHTGEVKEPIEDEIVGDDEN